MEPLNGIVSLVATGAPSQSVRPVERQASVGALYHGIQRARKQLQRECYEKDYVYPKIYIFCALYFQERSVKRVRLSRLTHCESQFKLRTSCEIQRDNNDGKECTQQNEYMSSHTMVCLSVTANRMWVTVRTSNEL